MLGDRKFIFSSSVFVAAFSLSFDTTFSSWPSVQNCGAMLASVHRLISVVKRALACIFDCVRRHSAEQHIGRGLATNPDKQRQCFSEQSKRGWLAGSAQHHRGDGPTSSLGRVSMCPEQCAVVISLFKLKLCLKSIQSRLGGRGLAQHHQEDGPASLPGDLSTGTKSVQSRYRGGRGA